MLEMSEFMAKLYPLFSGSKGNCYYVCSGSGGVLLDVGVSAKRITEALYHNEIDIKSIKAIFITHEHSDHISGLRVFASKHGIDVYACESTVDAIERKGLTNDKYKLHKVDDTIIIDDMKIDSFKISHDSFGGLGYVVHTGDGRKLGLATDTGMLTSSIKKSLLGCDTVVIESNHDVDMLLNGMYPYDLKRRILSDIGHLSNETCSNFLPHLVKSGTTKIVLAHLSEENNMPLLAYQSAVSSLLCENMKIDNDYKLSIAPIKTNGTSIIY